MNRPLGSAADALLAMAARGGTQLFALTVTLVATRYLSPGDFGVFALATVFITVVRNLLYAGPAEFLLKTRDADRDAADCLAAMMVTTLLASAAVAGLTAGLCGAVAWAIGIVPVRARAREALIQLTQGSPAHAKAGVPEGDMAAG